MTSLLLKFKFICLNGRSLRLMADSTESEVNFRILNTKMRSKRKRFDFEPHVNHTFIVVEITLRPNAHKFISLTDHVHLH